MGNLKLLLDVVVTIDVGSKVILEKKNISYSFRSDRRASGIDRCFREKKTSRDLREYLYQNYLWLFSRVKAHLHSIYVKFGVQKYFEYVNTNFKNLLYAYKRRRPPNVQNSFTVLAGVVIIQNSF